MMTQDIQAGQIYVVDERVDDLAFAGKAILLLRHEPNVFIVGITIPDTELDNDRIYSGGPVNNSYNEMYDIYSPNDGPFMADHYMNGPARLGNTGFGFTKFDEIDLDNDKSRKLPLWRAVGYTLWEPEDFDNECARGLIHRSTISLAEIVEADPEDRYQLAKSKIDTPHQPGFEPPTLD